MPPTRMSRSDSDSAPAGDERVREHDDLVEPALGRVGADALDRGARARTCASARRRARPSRRRAAGTGCRRSPRSSSTTGSVSASSSVRRCTPACAASARPNPSRIAESWLPLVSTTSTPAAANAAERLVEQRHRVGRRHGPVVDVAGDQHRVDPALDRGVDQPRQEGALVLEHRLAVQGAAQMPVGGVQQSHRFAVWNGAPTVSGRRPDGRLRAGALRARTPARRCPPAPARRSRSSGHSAATARALIAIPGMPGQSVPKIIRWVSRAQLCRA